MAGMSVPGNSCGVGCVLTLSSMCVTYSGNNISDFGISFGDNLNTVITKITDYILAVPPTAPVWGNITGTLSNQTDLQAALNTKASISSLAEVAFSGSYTDLINTPIIPPGQIQSDWDQSNNTALDYIKNKPTVLSAFTNDTGFITASSTDTLTNKIISGSSNTITNIAESSVINLISDLVSKQSISEKAMINGYASLDGTGKVPASQLRGILYQFNVKDYGAIGDGITNDTIAINSCITAALSFGLKTTIVFPEGVYLITSALTPLTQPIIIQGIGATLLSTGGSVYNIFDMQSDNIDIHGMDMVGSNTETGIHLDGFKFFRVDSCNFTTLGIGINILNTEVYFNGGNLQLNNFFNNQIGLFANTRGEYMTIVGGLYSGNQVGIQLTGGNNIFNGVNVNSNTTAFVITTGVNNAHCIISDCNINHNDHVFNIDSATNGMTITGCHMYQGDMTITNSSNIIFDNCVFNVSAITISNTNLSKIQNSLLIGWATTSIVINAGDDIVFYNNIEGSGEVPLPYNLGGRSHRTPQTGTILDLSTGDAQYISLSSDVTITSIINPVLNSRYRVEVVPNGFIYTLIDNTQLKGVYDPNSTLNTFDLLCIDSGSDPRFIGSISQPGILISRPTPNIKWYNLLAGAGSTGSISGNNITKLTGSTSNFDVTARSDKALLGDGYYQQTAVTGNANVIWGLATVESSNASYNLINYAIYFSGTNAVNVVESFVIVPSVSTTWNNGDWFRVKVTGSTVTYEKSVNSGGSWTTFYTSLIAATTFPLIPCSSIRALTTLTDARIVGTGVVNKLSNYYRASYANTITPSTKLLLGAGTATAGTAPLKLTSGVNLAIPENGAIEYDGIHYYGTISGVRYQLDNASSLNIQIFTSSGTWTKPAGAKVVDVQMIGGGSGAGSGRVGALLTYRGAAPGGSGGGMGEFTYVADALPSTVAITVGAGGAGAAAVSTPDTNGLLGSPGGLSAFGPYLRVYGSPAVTTPASNTGTINGVTGGGGWPWVASQFNGTNGAASIVTGNPAAATFSLMSPTGGGAGGAINVDNTLWAGSAGGPVGSTTGVGGIEGGYNDIFPGGLGGGTTGVGGNGMSQTPGFMIGGTGGGGGAPGLTGNAFAGGDGGFPGGGGGGGGGGTNGFSSGAGGKGGDGVVIVITYF